MRRGVLAGARAWAAPIAVITIVGISLSLSYPLFALLLERLGASGFAIGMTSTVAAVAMVASAPVMPIVLDRIGLVRLLVISTVGMAVLILLIPIWHNIWWWTLLRLLSGAFGTALFFASEFWIIAAAPPAQRGRIVAVYAIALSGSYWLGPELLRATGIDGWLPFLTAAGVVLLGLPALWWGRNDAPEAVTETRPKFSDSVKFFKSDPAVLYGVLLFGIIEFGAMALISVWSVRVGLDEDAALLLMARLALGAMLFQLPIGWAADRFDRRGVLALAGFCSVLAPLAMIAVAPLLPALIACVVVLGRHGRRALFGCTGGIGRALFGRRACPRQCGRHARLWPGRVSGTRPDGDRHGSRPSARAALARGLVCECIHRAGRGAPATRAA